MRTLLIVVKLNPIGVVGEQVLRNVERETIKQTLELCDGCVAEAARRLGIFRVVLQRKIKRLRIHYVAKKGPRP